MSGGFHIAPHRLADAVAGRASWRELSRVERHVARCARCAAAHERLERARLAMADIASQPAPDLGWDHIGVRVYWSTSSARHKALRERRSGWWRQPSALAGLSALGLAAAAGFALTLWSSQGEWVEVSPPVASVPVADMAGRPVATPTAAAAAEVPAGPPLRGLVTFASGAVSVDGAEPRPLGHGADVPALFSSAIVRGAHLRTGAGRLLVQFGLDSGLALQPGSSVRLRKFDDREIEIAVEEGAVEVEVSHRRQGQTFTVVAGRHSVKVLGTAFQVTHRAGDFDVQCARGQVLVSDGASQQAVSEGEQLQVLQRSLLGSALRQLIDRQRLAAMKRDLAQPLLLAWTESPALFDTSATVELAAPAGRAVRVDGVRVGAGSFALRVMSGRHQLQVAGEGGIFGRSAWIVAEPRGRKQARGGRRRRRPVDGRRIGRPDGWPGRNACVGHTGRTVARGSRGAGRAAASPRTAEARGGRGWSRAAVHPLAGEARPGGRLVHRVRRGHQRDRHAGPPQHRAQQRAARCGALLARRCRRGRIAGRSAGDGATQALLLTPKGRPFGCPRRFAGIFQNRENPAGGSTETAHNEAGLKSPHEGERGPRGPVIFGCSGTAAADNLENSVGPEARRSGGGAPRCQRCWRCQTCRR